MSQCKIVESSKKLWKDNGSKIQSNPNHIFFLEQRNESMNNFIYNDDQLHNKEL